MGVGKNEDILMSQVAEMVAWLNTHRLLDKLLFHCIKRVGNQEIMLQIF
jgi:hypothetical protein